MRRIFSNEEKDIIYKEYIENGRGLLYVSKQVNSSPETLKKFLKENNIHIRTFSEAASLSNKNRAFKKNNQYFKKENSNMAWILGFLASDGSIRKDRNEIKIGLSKIDKEILLRIKKEMQIENNVKEFINNQGYECCTLQWTSEEHKKDLAKYNIIPQKTFKLQPPYILNKKYYKDFIRGYFDGDGTINTNGSGLRFSICSATKEILEWIINYFYEEFNIPKVNIHQQHRVHMLYYFEYSTRATKKIYSIIYKDAELFLQRKKDKFEKLINDFN